MSSRRLFARRSGVARSALVLGLCGVAAMATACAEGAIAVPATMTVSSIVVSTAEPETVTAAPQTVTAPGTTEVRTTTRTVVTTAAPPRTTAPRTTAPTTTASRTTAFDPAKNIYISKSIGSQARLVSQDGVTQLQAFTITEIRPGFRCTAPNPATPKLGRFLGIRVTNEISAKYRPSVDPVLIQMSRVSFKVTSGGVTTDYLDGIADGCLRDQDRVSPATTPGTKSTGWIVLDTKDIHGTIYLDYPPGTPGWQWVY